MTVTQAQIDKMKAKGLNYTSEIARAANELDMPLYLLVAMLVKETGTVRNVYGHDVGGALAGFEKPVNKGNYEVFWWMVVENGKPSNGVGPSQLTYKGYHTDMKKKGLDITDPYQNIKYGGKVFFDHYIAARESGLGVRDSIKKAGKLFNTGNATGWETFPYAEKILEIALEWKDLLGNSDYK